MTGNEFGRESDDSVPSAGLGVTDAYFILFRRKWLILGCSILGFLAAGVARRIYPRPYESQAKLLVKYVVENRGAEGLRGESPTRMIETRPDNVVNSEVEILGSFDI